VQAEVLLRAQGEALAAVMRSLKVPDLIVDHWHQSWVLMVVDAAEDDEPVENVVLRTVQAMTTARGIFRVYGDGKA